MSSKGSEPFTGKSLLNLHLWFQTNANSLGTNSLHWSMNALSLCHMQSPSEQLGNKGKPVTPILITMHGWALTGSEDFDFPTEQWET